MHSVKIKDSRRNLSDTGEIRAIELLTRKLPTRSDVLVPAGDDCAVVRVNGCKWDLLLTSDPVICNVHFDSHVSPSNIGMKAANRALSDIAAMGGEPLWLLVDVVAPPSFKMNTLRTILRGVRNAAWRFRATIAGGDLSQGSDFQIHVFAVGKVPRNRAVLRSGASPGDSLCVTGSLGGSILGRHATFVPRIKEGVFLRRWATSMIDISDGLAADLIRLTRASGVGAVINVASLPISPDTRHLHDGRSSLEHAIEDGEDFELLFTVPNKCYTKFIRSWRNAFRLPCTRIGFITSDSGKIRYTDDNGYNLPRSFSGFTHFSRQIHK